MAALQAAAPIPQVARRVAATVQLSGMGPLLLRSRPAALQCIARPFLLHDGELLEAAVDCATFLAGAFYPSELLSAVGRQASMRGLLLGCLLLGCFPLLQAAWQ